ncbi:MAG: hypothetical protein IPK74_37015 [Deltaproteobacteria bacterium]|nr:hypothetical protein [Deltaproteobacteria bacterium]
MQPTEAPTSTNNTEFPCEACGAKLLFQPGTSELSCPYCGHRQQIAAASAPAPIVEHDFRAALAQARTATAKDLSNDATQVQCTFCGAVSVTTRKADHCAFCGSPVVLSDDGRQFIRPESLLPFAIDAKRARSEFERWLTQLWFAPGDLAKRAKASGMDGVYLPYWTYDSATRSQYSGERGDAYWETESYTDSEGRRQTRQVRKIRWHHVRGQVDVEFDDVLVAGTKSLPRDMLEKLEPWDLGGLAPFDPAYLSGFLAERYGIDLEGGFAIAQERMDSRIRDEVRRDIGGDEQRIHGLQTTHHDTTFKHLLLPLWISSFRYGEKVHRFVVNARTGAVAGERPWSTAKIVLAVLAALVVIGAIVAIAMRSRG